MKMPTAPLRTLQIVWRFGLDVALWFAAPIAFILVYVRGYSAPLGAGTLHLVVVAFFLAALILLRLAIARAVLNRTVAAILSTVVVSTVLALLLTYYALALAGLHSWGGIVAWNVIPTFFEEAPQLVDALGVPLSVVYIVIGLLALGLIAACWAYLRRFDWTTAAAHRMSGPALSIFLMCSFAILAMEAYKFTLAPWTSVSEPLSLTLFPVQGKLDMEGHAIAPLVAQGLDRVDDAARAAYVATGPTTRRNVILIVVDALRPDHMGIYGYARDTTPNLNKLTQSGNVRVVTGMHASCGDTICGLLSLSTSKFPRRFSYHPFTLQEALRRNGYRVHMVLSGDHTYFYSLRSFYGPVDSFLDGTGAQGYFMNDDQFLIDRVASMPASDGTPVMFQFHLMSAHILRKKDTTPGKFQPAARYAFQKAQDVGADYRPVETATNFYDNGVLKADAIIHDLLDALQKKGFLDNALVIITADHGESLGEHGLFHHANSVREQLLRIPFVLISYGYRPERPVPANELSAQVDIAPTILSELGLPRPQTWVGRALQEPGTSDFMFFEEKSLFGVIDRRDPLRPWKYWIDAATGTQHAFDLSSDPSELHDLASHVPPARQTDWRLLALSGLSSVLVAAH
jgi:glucan phosphoethanolaminetransferase (alkaline phosphatase superfamily)